MYNIYHNNKSKEISFKDFSETMLEICKKHKSDNRALAFAFILWDFEAPQFSKVLRDKEYWSSLNSISGEYLTVFSIHTHMKEERDAGINHFLTNIHSSYGPKETNNILIKKYFPNIDISFPAILFFQVDDKDIVDSFVVCLKENHIEDAYIEIKNLLSSATIALKRITKENLNNHAEIFNCLREEVRSSLKFKLFKRVSRGAVEILNLIATIKSL